MRLVPARIRPGTATLQAEEDEEHGSEDVPQGGEDGPRAFRHLTRKGDPDQEGPDPGRDLEVLGDAGHEQGEADNLEQQNLVVGAEDGPAERGAEAQ
jgi:hypothetical protein